jgi:hypothetical protein
MNATTFSRSVLTCSLVTRAYHPVTERQQEILLNAVASLLGGRPVELSVALYGNAGRGRQGQVDLTLPTWARHAMM